MGLLKKVNRIFDKNTKVKLFFMLLAIMFSGIVETLTVALVAPFISVLLDNSIVFSNPYLNWVYNFFSFDNANSLLAFLAFLLASVYIFRSLYVFGLGRIKTYFLARRRATYSKQMISKLLGFSYLYHTHKNIAEIQRFINGDISELFNMMSNIMSFLVDFFMTFFMLAYLFYESPAITSVVLGLTLICVALYFLVFRKKIRTASLRTRRLSVKMNKAVFQLFGGIKEIKVLRREEYFESVYNRARDKSVKIGIRYAIIKSLPPLTLEIICYGGAFIIMGFFILSGVDFSAMVPQLSLFVLAAFRIIPAITKQVGNITDILYHRAAVDAVYKNRFEEKDVASEVKHIASNDTYAGDASSDIIISNVSFAYPRVEESVLEDVSFIIPENKSVALVGPSGVGKTTLADLILGVLTPDAGTVLYKGQPVYDNELWSKSVGYIPQHIYLLDESILVNVAFGIYNKDIDEDKVWRALEQAQLKEFVETLPDGIRTVIGDRGIRLSGGQRQRVGIARAMYDDPPVLVLDEATSSLDNDTEKAVMDAIMGFHGSKTMLIIAHRLTTIEHCDIIYRVEDKNVTRER